MPPFKGDCSMSRTSLVLGRSGRLARVFVPYIVAFNSLSRIARVPLITMVFGFGIVMSIGIRMLEARLLRWRPEHRGGA
jgi:NitT/TauT family transport system permease protein